MLHENLLPRKLIFFFYRRLLHKALIAFVVKEIWVREKKLKRYLTAMALLFSLLMLIGVLQLVSAQPNEVASSTCYQNDPAGYVYDVNTNARVQGATVWLQRPDGSGGWENVPTGQSPAIMQPDTNPLTTDINGQYQWDTLPGSYRVHVEAPGYNPADSIVVNVPPPVFDLNIGLSPIQHSPTASFTEDLHTAPVNIPISFDPSDSYDDVDAIVLYEWDWTSDGIYDTTTFAPTVVTHSFNAPGTYTVTLRVTDAAGNTDTASDTKTITEELNVVPETPFGTIAASAAMITALLSICAIPRLRTKRMSH